MARAMQLATHGHGYATSHPLSTLQERHFASRVPCAVQRQHRRADALVIGQAGSR